VLQAIYEGLFCPIHGLFRPANWIFLGPGMAAGIGYGRILAEKLLAGVRQALGFVVSCL
jgi:hypothetical protein